MYSLFQNFSRKFLFLGIAAAVLLVLLGGRVLRDGAWSTQVAQVGSASQGVSAKVVVSSTEFDCVGNAETLVRFDIVPQAGGEIKVIDHGNVRIFDALQSYEEDFLKGHFSNGNYEALLTALPGYTVVGDAVLPFSVNTNCDTPSPLPSPTPIPPPPPPAENATKTAVAAPPPPKTTPPPAPKTEPVPSTTPIVPPPTSPTSSEAATEEKAEETLASTSPLEACGSEEECLKMCAENDSNCRTYTTEIILEKPASQAGEAPLFVPDVAVVEQYIEARGGVRVFADADSDGIVDYDEVNIFGTDPKKADSDNDGASDSDELIAHTDPVSVSTTTLIVFEDPSQYGAVTGTSTLGVTAITPGETTNDASGTPRLSSLVLSGHGPANAFITLYIYSEPIVVTVKTDRSGSWTYTLKRELPDGTHKVYTALTDNGGRVIARSEPLPFVKEASAISIGSAILPNQEQAPSFFGGMNAVAMISLLAAVVLASVIVLGIFVRTKKDDVGGTPGMA